MSLSDGTPMMTMPVAPANSGNGGGFGWGGDGAWLIILFLILPSLAGAATAGETTAIPAAWSTAMC